MINEIFTITMFVAIITLTWQSLDLKMILLVKLIIYLFFQNVLIPIRFESTHDFQIYQYKFLKLVF